MAEKRPTGGGSGNDEQQVHVPVVQILCAPNFQWLSVPTDFAEKCIYSVL